jgi:hypothetical protein
MYKASQVVSETMKAMWQIFGAIMDVFLAPLMPIIVEILELMASVIPIVSNLATAFFEPIVAFLAPKIEAITRWLEGIDWTAVEGWLAKAGETVAGWIETVYNWLASTVWPWLSANVPKLFDWLTATAWPWIVENTLKLYEWFVSTAWPWLVQNFHTALDWWRNTAWPWLVNTAWPAILGTVEAFVGWWQNTAWPWLRDTAWPELSRIVTSIWGWLTSTLAVWVASIVESFPRVLEVLREAVDWARDTYLTIADALPTIGMLLGIIAGALIGDAVGGRLGALIGIIAGGFGGYNIGKGIQDLMDPLTQIVRGTEESVQRGWQTVQSLDEVGHNVRDNYNATERVAAEVRSNYRAIQDMNASVTNAIYSSGGGGGGWHDHHLQLLQLGSHFVPRTGSYILHRGEEVRTNRSNQEYESLIRLHDTVNSMAASIDQMREGNQHAVSQVILNRRAMQPVQRIENSIEMHNVFHIALHTSMSVDDLAKEIEDKITTNLTTVLRRTS